jgi:hypothetical protein
VTAAEASTARIESRNSICSFSTPFIEALMESITVRDWSRSRSNSSRLGPEPT